MWLQLPSAEWEDDDDEFVKFREFAMDLKVGSDVAEREFRLIADFINSFTYSARNTAVVSPATGRAPIAQDDFRLQQGVTPDAIGTNKISDLLPFCVLSVFSAVTKISILLV